MKEVLEKYSYCNLFSLSHYYEEYNISEDEAKRIAEESKRFYKESCYRQLSYNKEVQPSFYDKIIKEVEENVLYSNKTENQLEDEYFESGLGTIYYDFQFYREQLNYLENLKKSKLQYKSIVESDEEYKELIPFIKKRELSFETHCTKSAALFETYYFELNDITKKWLLKHKDVFDFGDEYLGDLQDFALYKDEELKFSSCTHEKYHSDIKTEEE